MHGDLHSTQGAASRAGCSHHTCSTRGVVSRLCATASVASSPSAARASRSAGDPVSAQPSSIPIHPRLKRCDRRRHYLLGRLGARLRSAAPGPQVARRQPRTQFPAAAGTPCPGQPARLSCSWRPSSAEPETCTATGLPRSGAAPPQAAPACRPTALWRARSQAQRPQGAGGACLCHSR